MNKKREFVIMCAKCNRKDIIPLKKLPKRLKLKCRYCHNETKFSVVGIIRYRQVKQNSFDIYGTQRQQNRIVFKITWINGKNPFENPIQLNETIDDISFDTYNDLCSECSEHNKCHKNGIDYEKIQKCKRDLEKQTRLNETQENIAKQTKMTTHIYAYSTETCKAIREKGLCKAINYCQKTKWLEEIKHLKQVEFPWKNCGFNCCFRLDVALPKSKYSLHKETQENIVR